MRLPIGRKQKVSRSCSSVQDQTCWHNGTTISPPFGVLKGFIESDILPSMLAVKAMCRSKKRLQFQEYIRGIQGKNMHVYDSFPFVEENNASKHGISRLSFVVATYFDVRGWSNLSRNTAASSGEYPKNTGPLNTTFG